MGSELYLCDLCGRFEPLDRVRLRSKRQDTWRCSSCHSNCQTLRRIEGVWPSPSFRSLSCEQQTSFMSSIVGMSSTEIADALETLESVTVTEEQGEQFVDGGEFLPLGVWSTRGFNSDAIAAMSLPSDRKSHAVF